MFTEQVERFVSALIDMTKKGLLTWEHFPQQYPFYNNLFIQNFIETNSELDKNHSYFFFHQKGVVLFIHYTSSQINGLYIQTHFGEPIINLTHKCEESSLDLLEKEINHFMATTESLSNSIYKFMSDIEKLNKSSQHSSDCNANTDIPRKFNTIPINLTSAAKYSPECLSDLDLETLDDIFPNNIQPKNIDSIFDKQNITHINGFSPASEREFYNKTQECAEFKKTICSDTLQHLIDSYHLMGSQLMDSQLKSNSLKLYHSDSNNHLNNLLEHLSSSIHAICPGTHKFGNEDTVEDSIDNTTEEDDTTLKASETKARKKSFKFNME